MTIKKIYRKIRVYNEVAEAIGTEKLAIEINIYDTSNNVKMSSFNIPTYGAFKRAVNAEYTATLANVLLAYNKLGFNKDSRLGGNTISVRVYAV